MKPLVIALILGLVVARSYGRQIHLPQPQMNDAIVELEKARKSEHPIEHLEKAKIHLEKAAHDKHGERVEALKQVKEAIEAAKKKEHKLMEVHITKAIDEVREGRHEARK